MTDKKKTILAIFFMGCTFILPLLAAYIGWQAKDWQTGLWAALVVFFIFLLLTIVTLTRLKIPDWFTVVMPVVFSLFYFIAPDFIPGPVDDAGAMLFSSIMSLRLWLKRKRALKQSQYEALDNISTLEEELPPAGE